MIRKPRTTELNVDFLVRMTTLKNIYKFYNEITTVRTYKLFSTGCIEIFGCLVVGMSLVQVRTVLKSIR